MNIRKSKAMLKYENSVLQAIADNPGITRTQLQQLGILKGKGGILDTLLAEGRVNHSPKGGFERANRGAA